MLDHVTIGISNLARAQEFYDRALKPLGIERLFADGETASGYGVGNSGVLLDWHSRCR